MELFLMCQIGLIWWMMVSVAVLSNITCANSQCAVRGYNCQEIFFRRGLKML